MHRPPQSERSDNNRQFSAAAGHQETGQAKIGGPEAKQTPPPFQLQASGEPPSAPPESPVGLTNARFVGNETLQQIMDGEIEQLSASQNGTTVELVQQALIDSGFPLLRYGPDGRYGNETESAINQFRNHVGLGPGGMDADALGRLDRSAPAPDTRTEHHLDYNRLLADNQLDITVGMGFDEGNSHVAEIQELLQWLNDNGFTDLGSTQPGIHRFRADEFVYNPSLNLMEWPTVNITVITPEIGASDAFLNALNNSEITIYSGHARGGLGPDFDDKHDADEQVVLGRESSQHDRRGTGITTPRDPYHRSVSSDRTNDFETMTNNGEWDTDRYRVWFFSACTTLNYMDEIRNGLLPQEMGRENLDVFGSDKVTPLIASAEMAITFIQGILGTVTAEQMVDNLNQSTRSTILNHPQFGDLSQRDQQSTLDEFNNPYFVEGVGDNEVAGTAPVQRKMEGLPGQPDVFFRN